MKKQHQETLGCMVLGLCVKLIFLVSGEILGQYCITGSRSLAQLINKVNNLFVYFLGFFFDHSVSQLQ